MNRRMKWIIASLACLLLNGLIVSAVLAADSSADRKEQILANLRLTFSQLENTRITMGDISPSGYDNLDEGSFTIDGSQIQKFFVSQDNKKLYLLTAAPIDVSRSTDEVSGEMAKRATAAAEKTAEALKELDAVIVNQPYLGPVDAPVTIVEFSDFQCPYCSKGAKTVDQILAKYPKDVKLVFKHFPMDFHPWAKPAAIASYCGAQQKNEAFWILYDNYFENQKQLNTGNIIAKSEEYLAVAGIDMARWSTCTNDSNSAEHKAALAAIDADQALGKKLGVSGTPAFFVNGVFLRGAQPINAFEALIIEAKAKADLPK